MQKEKDERGTSERERVAILEKQMAAVIGHLLHLRQQMAKVPIAAGCQVPCTCTGTNCNGAHIHCAFQNGPIGPNTPNCIAGCTGQCDGTLPVGHAGLHSCTHGHPF